MKLCGHTMGTPSKDALEAIAFFADLGLDGIELRCAPDGQLDTDRASDDQLSAIGRAALAAGISVACLTPYLRNFATQAAAMDTLAGYERACRAAALLDCPLVRATGGVWPLDGAEREAIWHRTVEGLRRACDIAAGHGVSLALENHSGTLTQSATDTVAMVTEVDRPNLGILMDHYWVVLAGEEDPIDAVHLQAPYVLHCHCKNLVYRDGKPLAGFLDEGGIDWLQVLSILHQYGYAGYLSDEYEKYWRPELPEPEEGMARNARYLRECLARIEA